MTDFHNIAVHTAVPFPQGGGNAGRAARVPGGTVRQEIWEAVVDPGASRRWINHPRKVYLLSTQDSSPGTPVTHVAYLGQ